jgi:hypothetical protein
VNQVPVNNTILESRLRNSDQHNVLVAAAPDPFDVGFLVLLLRDINGKPDQDLSSEVDGPNSPVIPEKNEVFIHGAALEVEDVI